MTEHGRSTRTIACSILALAVVLVFWPVLGHDFLAFDDETYVTENQAIQEGFTAKSLAWSWTTFHGANWHPLTWMSHILDWQLYGPHPAGHHLTNLLLHVANTLVLFLLLQHMTGDGLRSALVAGLFGIHPLHVESVAWVAERKDLLSTLFWFLTIAAYLRYVRAPSVARYLAVALALALGLCAKPMLVSVPLVLLLLDYWPLGRFGAGFRLVREKLPLLALSVAACVVTLLAQGSARALVSLEIHPLGARLANAVLAYAAYLWKTVWPVGLAAHYPHPGSAFSLPHVALAATVLVLIGTLAWRQRGPRPFLLVGWSWFLITLVPVIGLVQVGRQAMADRYTYVPLIGIFIGIVWAVPRAVGREGSKPAVRSDTGVLALALVTLPLLAVVSWFQVEHWKNTETLFRHALAVTEENAVAHNGVGQALFREGRLEEAREHLSRAVEINPRMAEAHNSLGGVLAAQGHPVDAMEAYRRAIRADPMFAEALNNLGVALANQQRLEEAVESFHDALRVRPDYGKAHSNLAAALYSLGRYEQAWSAIEQAWRYGHDPPAGLVERLTAEREGR